MEKWQLNNKLKILLLVSLFLVTVLTVNNVSSTIITISNTQNSLNEHDEIVALDNEELLALAENESWTGTGLSEDDPIIIENYSFNYTNHAIHLYSTNLHVLIRNINVIGQPDNSSQCAIVLDSTSNVLFENNEIFKAHLGIVIASPCENITIKNSRIHSASATAIQIETSSNIMVIGNSIHHNGGIGIHIFGSKDCTVSSNDIHTNDKDGIFLQGLSKSNLIDSNNITNNKEYGVKIDQLSNTNTISNNQLIGNNQAYIDEGFDNIFEGNVTPKTSNGFLVISVIIILPIYLRNKRNLNFTS